MQQKRKMLIGIIISALFLVLIFYNVNFKELILTLKEFNFDKLLFIVGIYASSLVARTLRWKFLLLSDKKFPLYQLGSTWVIGNLMNAFMPARAGDIWRAYEIGSNTKESKMKIFGSVMLERILDGISICTILYFCVTSYSNQDWLRNIANLSMLLFGGSLAVFYIIVKFNKIDILCNFLCNLTTKCPTRIQNILVGLITKLCSQFKLFVSGFSVFNSIYYSTLSIFTSFLVWILEIAITYFVITSFGIICPISAAMFVICFIALGSMIPSSSIFVGPYQYAYILALGIYSIQKSESLAIALIHQSILMASLIIFSLIFITINFICSLNQNQNSSAKKEENSQPIA